MSEHTISTLFEEERRFPPPPAFAVQANAQADIYQTEVYQRQLRLKTFNSRLDQLFGEQEPGHIDDEHIDY